MVNGLMTRSAEKVIKDNSIGAYYYPNGDKYVGEYQNGKKNGKGICYFASGDTYEGDWKDNKMDGNGI